MQEWLSHPILSYLGLVALAVLALNTVRDAIAMTGVYPRGWRGAWILYGRYDEALLVHALGRLGLSRFDVDQVARNVKITPIKNPILDLLAFLTRIVTPTDVQVAYGDVTPTVTRFYLNSMGAAHDPEELNLMARLLCTLFYQAHGPAPQFVISPKDGNALLGFRFARINGLIQMASKGKSDPSRARFADEQPLKALLLNFEGAGLLVRRAKLAQARGEPRLRGIVVDCNASGGSNILRAMTEFNALVDRCGAHVEPLSEAFVLFRSDTEDDIDAAYEDGGYKIHRYVDLDEDMKRKIADSGPLARYGVASLVKLLQLRNALEEKKMLRATWSAT